MKNIKCICLIVLSLLFISNLYSQDEEQRRKQFEDKYWPHYSNLLKNYRKQFDDKYWPNYIEALANYLQDYRNAAVRVRNEIKLNLNESPVSAKYPPLIPSEVNFLARKTPIVKRLWSIVTAPLKYGHKQNMQEIENQRLKEIKKNRYNSLDWIQHKIKGLEIAIKLVENNDGKETTWFKFVDQWQIDKPDSKYAEKKAKILLDSLAAETAYYQKEHKQSTQQDFTEFLMLCELIRSMRGKMIVHLELDKEFKPIEDKTLCVIDIPGWKAITRRMNSILVNNNEYPLICHIEKIFIIKSRIITKTPSSSRKYWGFPLKVPYSINNYVNTQNIADKDPNSWGKVFMDRTHTDEHAWRFAKKNMKKVAPGTWMFKKDFIKKFTLNEDLDKYPKIKKLLLYR